MVSLKERIVNFTDACGDLLAQLNELAELHEQVRIKQLALAVGEPLKQRPGSVSLGSK
jgi:hypothetical protein